jgi:hypothetical protein
MLNITSLKNNISTPITAFFTANINRHAKAHVKLNAGIVLRRKLKVIMSRLQMAV